MKDETLLKVSLAVALIGLVGLFFIGQNMEPSMLQIAQLNDDILDQKVQVSGTAISVRTTNESHTFFSLDDGTGKIKVVAFASAKLQAPKEGSSIVVKGRLQEYKGQLEIVAEQISAP